MRHGNAIRNFVVYLVLVPAWEILLRLFRIPERLGEDAIVHWLNEQIAEKLGIASPTVEQVSGFAVEWLPPAVLALICLSGWLLYLHGHWRLPHGAPLTARTSEQLLAALPNDAPAVSPSRPAPDWTIRELFYYLRRDIDPNGPTKVWDEVGSDVLDKFSTGQLHVWGRELIRTGGEPKFRNLAPIDSSYWKDARLTFVFLVEGHEKDRHADIGARSDRPAFGDLRVSRAEARDIWSRGGDMPAIESPSRCIGSRRARPWHDGSLRVGQEPRREAPSAVPDQASGGEGRRRTFHAQITGDLRALRSATRRRETRPNS
jgi:hypothetical protein